ncbi:MAG: tetratricopeptide repeat protein, partial [Pseudomonadota bacterium]
DNRTITNLLPTLQPGILPIPGSNVEMAIELAVDLARKSNIDKASLLLITDGIVPEAISRISASLPNTIDLTILGIGTEQGAPIPTNQGPLRDTNGNIILAKYQPEPMQALARLTGGYYLPLQADNSDIQFFQKHLQQRYTDANQENGNARNTDLWNEFGPALLVFILPLAALAFRRGLLLSTVIMLSAATFIHPPLANAQSFFDRLWKNGDQQGANAWSKEDYQSAVEAFNDPQWKASAHYKNKDYEQALMAFSQDDSAIGHYNRGNALAKLEQYEQALSAYEQALSRDPTLDSAQINKKRVEDFLKNQQSQTNNAQSDDKQNQSDNGQQASGNKATDASDAQNPNGQRQSPQQQSQQQNSGNGEANNEISQGDTEDQNQQGQAQQSKQAANDSNAEQLSAEQQQALQQWLQKVPDDPSGLLRRKFQYEFQKRRELYQRGQWKLPENNAHNRY